MRTGSPRWRSWGKTCPCLPVLSPNLWHPEFLGAILWGRAPFCEGGGARLLPCEGWWLFCTHPCVPAGSAWYAALQQGTASQSAFYFVCDGKNVCHLGTCLQIRAITHAVRKQIVKFLLRNCHISNKRARCWLQDTPLNHCWLWNFFSCASYSLCTVQGFMVLGMIIVDWTPKIGHCRPWLLACVEPRATLVHYVLTPWPAGWPVCFLKVPCTLNQYMT